MTTEDYDTLVNTTALYPREDPIAALDYVLLGMCSESGECAGKLKKLHRGDYDLDHIKKPLVDEVCDVLWYCTAALHELGLTLGEGLQLNADKLTSRLERGVITGNGDNR